MHGLHNMQILCIYAFFRILIVIINFYVKLFSENPLIGEQTIPKGTGLFVHQYSILNDEKYWQKPNEFIPERFLEDGKYLSTRPSAFIPFGVGRRVCLGEKLALADLFLVLVRFIQATEGYEIVLENDPKNYSLEPDADVVDSLVPHDYKIVFKKV